MKVPVRFRLLLLVARVFAALRLITDRDYEHIEFQMRLRFDDKARSLKHVTVPVSGRVWED